MSLGFAPVFIAALLQGAQTQAAPAAPQISPTIRQPAVARDGRVAAVIDGDIWILPPNASWIRLTSGGASDREPTWSPDGNGIVFSSDRNGKLDLWHQSVRATGPLGEPTQLTHSMIPDQSPVIARDGKIIFARGFGASSQLWVLSPDGSEARLTTNRATEASPSLSPDGSQLAYVALNGPTREVHVRALTSGADSVVRSDVRVDRVVWLDSTRLWLPATGTRGDSARILDLRTRELRTTRFGRAEPVMLPGTNTMLWAPVTPESNLAYNGDPDRLGDRTLMNVFAPGGALWRVDGMNFTGDTTEIGAPIVARADMNAEAFDQVWLRTANLYFSQPDAKDRRMQWDKLKLRYRPRAISAKDDDELKLVIHQMLAEHPPYRSSATGSAAVSSANPVATEAGLKILRAGGNVIDAAAAVSFALGVVEPDASGPGGYGQMLVFKQGMERPALIEFMTRVPEDAGIDSPNSANFGRGGGPAVVNVPGTVAAMYLAWQRYGSKKVSWADILAPAIAAARDGYPVSEGLATTLTVERDSYMQWESSRALFYKDGRAPHAGDTLKNPDLAWTLEQIAKGGADAFYKGEIAKRLVDDLHAHGNAIKMIDMARYFAADREPVATTYRNHTIYSSAPPVSGGAALASQLNLLEQFPNPKLYAEDAAMTHAMISAWQLAPSSRNRIADPSLWPVNTEPFTSKDTARIRWTCFDPAKALNTANIRVDSVGCVKATPGGAPSLAVASAPPACEAHGYDAPVIGPCRAAGTTAFVVGDADGNIVAVTQTLGTWGGGFYVTPGLGFLYNDKLNSYSGSDPNGYGVRLAGARNGSTLAPTIVFDGVGAKRKPVMAVGAAGNSWITSAVYQTLIGMIDANLDPQAALEQPRFLLGGGGRGGAGGVGVQMEDGWSPAVIKQLEAMGYRPQFVSLMGEVREGYGAALKIDRGQVTAGADPRRAGAAGAVKR